MSYSSIDEKKSDYTLLIEEFNHPRAYLDDKEVNEKFHNLADATNKLFNISNPYELEIKIALEEAMFPIDGNGQITKEIWEFVDEKEEFTHGFIKSRITNILRKHDLSWDEFRFYRLKHYTILHMIPFLLTKIEDIDYFGYYERAKPSPIFDIKACLTEFIGSFKPVTDEVLYELQSDVVLRDILHIINSQFIIRLIWVNGYCVIKLRYRHKEGYQYYEYDIYIQAKFDTALMNRIYKEN